MVNNAVCQLIGFLAGASYAPDLSQGGFMQKNSFRQEGARVYAKDKTINAADDTEHLQSVQTDRSGATGIYIPKSVSLSLQFTVLHKHLMGWSKSTFDI